MHKTTKIVYIILGVSILLMCLCFKAYNLDVSVKTTDMRTDTSLIKKNFNAINGIIECYWTVDIIGDKRTVGPQSYRFKGFIIIDENEAKIIKDTYTLDYKYSDYKEDLLPSNLKYELNLYYSEDLSKHILGTLWIGKVCFDYNNKILYLEAVNT